MGNRLTKPSKPAQSFDLFAEALWEYQRRRKARVCTEREDGRKSREDISWYFTTYRDYPMHEKDALKFARGKVLDVGCGAGRHALYLQRRGLSVTAIDISPSIVELAHTRGVRDARVADVCKKLPFKNGEFNTVVLFGNNLGICGTAVRFQRMLRELARVTTPDTRILGTTRQPSAFRRSERRYTRDGSGESEVSQVRLRLTDEKRTGEWFDFLLFSPTGLWQLAEKAGWEIEYLFGEDLDRGYAVVLKKS